MAASIPAIAPNWALFFDVDGTLLDYASRPEDVVVPDSLRRTLAGLSDALDGAVALVSGRMLDDVDRLFAPLKLPVAGQHGAEGRRNGSRQVFAPPSTALGAILAQVQVFAARHPAIRIENKGLSAQVNFRRDLSQREALGALLAEAIVATGADFQLYAGHDGYDIKPRGVNKGSVMDWFMAAPPFTGRVPVFIGNDRTDEDGFAAALARGGLAIKVGLEDIPTHAPLRMATPSELGEWLAHGVETLRPALRA
jgi:trehalose 6-phosphate phosphatase